MNIKERERKKVGSWNIHGTRILEHVGEFLECIEVED
jgi:hypothetical protein